MQSLRSSRVGLIAISVLARSPQTMLGMGLLLEGRHLTGSLAAAGEISAVYTGSAGIAAPLLARVVDRRGQTPVLVSGALITTALLCAVARLTPGVPLWVVLLLAAGI